MVSRKLLMMLTVGVATAARAERHVVHDGTEEPVLSRDVYAVRALVWKQLMKAVEVKEVLAVVASTSTVTEVVLRSLVMVKRPVWARSS